jgi:hypothetical protein
VVPPASVSLSGPVTTTLNNALKANVSINGTVMNLSCIPGGGCYNTSGKDVTAALTALGATDSQIYALMSAAYAAQATTPGVTVTGASTTTTATPVQTKRLPISVKRSGMHGMGAMVFTTRKNYVRKASRFA